MIKRGPGRPPKKRGRGRPKGSKNKPKILAPKKRGRPKGSKNKVKLKTGKPVTIWQKIQEHMTNTEYVPCSMIANKIGMHQKFVSAILTRKEHVGEVRKTRVKHEFSGYNKAFGYRLAGSNTEKTKKRA